MILISTQTFPPDVGGKEAYVGGLAEALAARGHPLLVLADTADTSEVRLFDSARGYPIRRFGGPRSWRRFWKGRTAAKLLRQPEFGSLIVDSWKSLEHLPFRALEGKRVLCLCHGNEYLPKQGTPKGRRIVQALAKASIAAANSRYTAELVRTFAGPETEIAVLHPGITAPLGAPRRLPPRTMPLGPRLISIARLEPRKGIDIVLKVLPNLLSRYPGLTYDVIGAGKDRARLIALAATLGVTSCTTFWGAVDEQKKAELLARADLFILPNRREPNSVEGFGLVFLEAAAFGVPSLAGSDGGAADAVRDNETGRVVSGCDEKAVHDAIAALLSDPNRLREMGEAAHARFWSEFAWDVAVTRFEDALMPK